METADLQTQVLRIGGMTCVNCQNRIEKKLKSLAGIDAVTVDYNTGTATITYNASVITFDEIKAVIEQLGYKALDKEAQTPVSRIIGTLVIILALYTLLRMFSISGLAASFPRAEEGMGYGMLLVIGLLTSVHCIAMCGGINLSQSLGSGIRDRGSGGKSPPSLQSAYGGLPLPPSAGVSENKHSVKLCPFDEGGTARAQENAPVCDKGGLALVSPAGDTPATPPSSVPRSLLPSILYNGGRLISYTAVGVAVGALGSAITVSGRLQGAVMLLAGILMLIMGINMLGLFPALRRIVPRMPKFFAKKINEKTTGRGPLIVGVLNGFMPCGPLQAIQLYALSTGSPVRGGVSMFLFCAGTIPLMFALGALSSYLSSVKGQVFSRRVAQAGAVIIAAMGLAMFTNGWNLAGFVAPFGGITAAAASSRTEGDAFTPVIQNGKQIVNSTLYPNRYPAIVVQQGIPVRWTINAPPGSVNGCNNRLIIREYGIEHTFRPGDNVIEFLPTRTGRFSYSCWMGMIRSTVTVVAEGESVADISEPSIAPAPAGVDIPTDKIALARIIENYQTVEITLTDDGFEPSIVVMQRQTPALWNINIASFDPGNDSLIFPAYYTALGMRQGDNTIQIIPGDDFEFSTGDNVFYGYVKVVNDINFIDIEAIKTEVADYETLIYPEAYFEAAAGGGCACCR